MKNFLDEIRSFEEAGQDALDNSTDEKSIDTKGSLNQKKQKM